MGDACDDGNTQFSQGSQNRCVGQPKMKADQIGSILPGEVDELGVILRAGVGVFQRIWCSASERCKFGCETGNPRGF